MPMKFTFPYVAINFDKDGQAKYDPAKLPSTSDVLVISHGWNNSAAEAEALYDELLTNMQQLSASLPNGRALSVVGILWPSKQFKFADQQPASAGGPAASLGDGAAVGGDDVQIALENLKSAFAEDPSKKVLVAEIARLVENRRTEAPAQGKELVLKLRQLLGTGEKSKLDGSRVFMDAADPGVIFARASVPVTAAANAQTSAAANFLTDALGKIDDGFQNLLNLTSYYKMKERAGTVGKNGAAKLIEEIAARPGVRHIHLAGHSFGARLVTAAALATKTSKIHSMSLLQAAFSHNGFSEPDAMGNEPTGYFRAVIEQQRVKGPILVTHSRHDHAVGTAYAVASRVSGTDSAGVGSPKDKFGGMGANGALRVGSAFLNASIVKLGPSTTKYAWVAGRLHNLNSDDFISDHGDVRNAAVAAALGQAIASAA